MNPFEVLQISPNASPDEVKAAYHSLAKKWHPDRFSGQEKLDAEEKFREISQAFAAIKKDAGSAQSVSIETPPPNSVPHVEKTPQDWLNEAKSGLSNRHYETALSMSQYCFHYPQVAEEAHLIYAKAIEATSKDIKIQTRAYEEVVRINPNNKEAVVKLAHLYLALNMPARAASMSAKAKALGADTGIPKNHGTEDATVSSHENAGIINKVVGFFK